jgi:site-specific DNA-methyltransferase (cytosine-N4-specific)
VEENKEWFISLAPLFSELLAPNGSIVIEIGNAWEPGLPIQSTLHLESLIGFVKHPEAGLNLCQEQICYNPSRLPRPAQWVTVERPGSLIAILMSGGCLGLKSKADNECAKAI